MRLRNLKLAWRLLAREPLYSAVAVLGLAVALAACFLLFGLVRYAWTYNDAIAGADGIYVVKERRNLLPRPDWGESAPPPLARVALAAGLVQDATSAKPFQLAARVGERLLLVDLAVAAPNYLRFFGIKALAGDADAALARPDALVVSRSEALRLFGTADALGKVASIDGVPFVVRAVLADMPVNTSPEFGLLLGEGRHSWDRPPDSERQAWSRRARLYLKTEPAIDTAALRLTLEQAVATQRDSVFSGALVAGRPKPYTSIAVTPLSKVYFDPDLLSSRGGSRYGSPAAIAGLASLGILILALAVTNYVNLAAVRTAARRREIAVRKTLGISGAALAGQFLAESLLVGAASTSIGAVLAWLALPLFSELVGRPLSSTYGPAGWAMLAAIGLGSGLLSGLYPAWLAARVPASVALGGRGGETSEGQHMRRVLTAAQFAAAIGLAAASLAVWWQARYASHADPGFDPRPQLVIELPDKAGPAAAHAFRTELARQSDVAGVAAMQDAVGRDGNKSVIMIRRSGAESVPLELKDVGANFFEVFGLRPLAGKLFSREGEEGVVLNARAALALGFPSPEAAVGQFIDDDSRIIGIAPDLRYNLLREKPEAILYRLNEEQGVLTVRTRGDIAGARAAIEALWARHFPNDLPVIETASSVFARNYSDDLRQAKLLALASIVATALACFGIYVLSSYTIRRRAREFVLRKLHGATPRHIGLLVAREWLALLGVGALLALAPAWLWTERYLAGFVERAPMGWWPLAIACAGVGLVALAGCARQAVAAMRMSPALALRDQ
ncbi:ABC transporter permease [Massilia sp. 2TAF26]|uniref:ABC transporter permease n=1 Tax=Massilia sp. 2TAF26 TaxID=3233012 RepID=UPI003F95824D